MIIQLESLKFQAGADPGFETRGRGVIFFFSFQITNTNDKFEPNLNINIMRFEPCLMKGSLSFLTTKPTFLIVKYFSSNYIFQYSKTSHLQINYNRL